MCDITRVALIRLGVRALACCTSVRLTWSDERRVQCFDAVCGHDDFNISARVEPVQLIEELQHRPLDLTLAARVRVVPEGNRKIPQRSLTSRTLTPSLSFIYSFINKH